MKSTGQVKTLVAEKLGNRALPTARPTVTTPGVGASAEFCASCDDRIEVNDVDCVREVPERAPLHLHVDCFAAWRRKHTT